MNFPNLAKYSASDSWPLVEEAYNLMANLAFPLSILRIAFQHLSIDENYQSWETYSSYHMAGWTILGIKPQSVGETSLLLFVNGILGQLHNVSDPPTQPSFFSFQLLLLLITTP